MKSRQMSESIIIGLIMAFSGGFMDAYTYVFRDKVFANAQTGNIILFGLNLSSGDFSKAVEHLFPILAFTAGIFTAQLFRMHFKKRPHFHWRQLSLIAEIMIIIAVSFMPQSLNITADHTQNTRQRHSHNHVYRQPPHGVRFIVLIPPLEKRR